MATHTGTGEWQRFEVRMRERRAERLVERAREATSAGRADEARTCLEEARALAPALAATASVEQVLDTPAARRKFRLSYMAALVACPFAGALVVAAVNWTQPPAIVPLQDFRELHLAPEASYAGSSRHADPERTQPSVVSDQITERDIAADVPPTARDAALLTPERPSAPPSSAVGGAYDIATAGAAIETLPTMVPKPGTVASDIAVRGVLNRYEVAYNSRDTSGRRVTLGQCHIVIGGSTAHANCTGSIIRSARFGEPAQSEPRQWSFDLVSAGRDWHIVTMRVQSL